MCCQNIQPFNMYSHYPLLDQESPVNYLANQIASSQMISSQPSRNSASRASSQARRSIRIEKPRSAHNSPRNLERRKTTSAVRQDAAMDAQLTALYNDQHHRQQQGQTYWQPTRSVQRPMSWHPGFSQMYTQYTPPAAMSAGQPYHSSYFSSQAQPHRPASTYMAPTQTFPSSEVYIQQYSQPQYMVPQHGSAAIMPMSSQMASLNPSRPVSLDSSYFSYGHPQIQPSMPVQETKVRHIVPSEDYSRHFEQSAYTDTEVRNTQSLSIAVTGIQESNFASETEDASEDLVGMGLYDLPDNSSWLLCGGQSTGKGLKLEEPWQPPEDNDDDEDDVSSADESDEEPPVSNKQQYTMQPQIAPSSQPVVSTDLSGHSFFMEEDESVSKEWWYQAAKQPFAPVAVQQAGLGYGWLCPS